MSDEVTEFVFEKQSCIPLNDNLRNCCYSSQMSHEQNLLSETSQRGYSKFFIQMFWNYCDWTLQSSRGFFANITLEGPMNLFFMFGKLLLIDALKTFIKYFRNLMLYGPRHITNPSPLSIFWVQKNTHKKLQNFFEKVDWQFKTSHHLSPKHLKRHYPLKIRPDFDLKELENFWYQKICIFWPFSDIFKFHLQ